MTSRIDVIGTNGNDGEIYHHLHKHGHRPKSGPSPTYVSWIAMKARCFDPSHHGFGCYGGRGITVCDRWMDFTAFLADMGERPDGKTIDRIDPNGNYEPGNCRWATTKEQASNKRGSVTTEFRGKTKNLVEVADETGTPRTTVYRRYRQGYRGEELVSSENYNKKRVGERCAASKLTEADVRDVKRRLRAGETQASIAKSHDVAGPTISDIARGKAWSHIE